MAVHTSLKSVREGRLDVVQCGFFNHSMQKTPHRLGEGKRIGRRAEYKAASQGQFMPDLSDGQTTAFMTSVGLVGGSLGSGRGDRGIGSRVGVAEDVAPNTVGHLPGADSGVDIGHAGVAVVLLSAGLGGVVLDEEVEGVKSLELTDGGEPTGGKVGRRRGEGRRRGKGRQTERRKEGSMGTRREEDRKKKTRNTIGQHSRRHIITQAKCEIPPAPPACIWRATVPNHQDSVPTRTLPGPLFPQEGTWAAVRIGLGSEASQG